MRYAVSFAPPAQSGLWSAGCRWLGFDGEKGVDLPQPAVPEIEGNRLWELTGAARRIGLQAVVKSGFRLGPKFTREQLCAALADFASKQESFKLPLLTVKCRNERFVLEPEGNPEAMVALASDCVRTFDEFGLPLRPSEYAGYRAAGLTAQERRNLESWGNPYVFNQYRFRIRMTSRITIGTEKEIVYSALKRFIMPACKGPLKIDSLCLFVESEVGQPMRLYQRFFFSGLTKTTKEPIAYDSVRAENIYPGYQRRSS